LYAIQIPKDVTHILFSKYYDPDQISREDLSAVDDRTDLDSLDNESIQESSNGEKSDNGSNLPQLYAQSGYSKLTTLYIKALVVIGISFSTALTANYLILRRLDPYPGTLALSQNVYYRADRVGLIVSDKMLWPNSTFPFNDPQRSEMTYSRTMMYDVNNITSSQVSLLYGDDVHGIPLGPISPTYTALLFGDGYQKTQYTGLYDIFNNFIDSAKIVAELPSVTSTNPSVATVLSHVPNVMDGYRKLTEAIISNIAYTVYVVRCVAFGGFGFVILVIFITQGIFWRKILDYLIYTENERTLKLLLMIPPEVVADIDSLRDLFHLKKSKVVSTATGPVQTVISTSAPQQTASSGDNGSIHGNIGNNGPIPRLRSSLGNARARPFSFAADSHDFVIPMVVTSDQTNIENGKFTGMTRVSSRDYAFPGLQRGLHAGTLSERDRRVSAGSVPRYHTRILEGSINGDSGENMDIMNGMSSKSSGDEVKETE
jgi:hypothetical protein